MKANSLIRFELTLTHAVLKDNHDGQVVVEVEVPNGPEVNSTAVFDAIESLSLNNADKVHLNAALEQAFDEITLKHLMQRGVLKAMRTF